MKKLFGTFLKEKRIKKNISIRNLSKIIGISPEYLSKIENNSRSAPQDIVLNKIADKLSLCIEDREILFDLAAESKSYLSLAPDLILYIRENENVLKALRLAKRCGVNDKDWQIFIEIIAEKYL